MMLTACSGTEGESSTPADSSQTSTGTSDASSSTQTSSSAQSVKKKENPDQFTAAFNGEPGVLDPQNNTTVTGGMIEKQIYEPLIDKDPETGEFIPVLATEWEWVDETHLSLTLREGVKFHNGEDFTADDVAYTISRFPTGSATGSLFEPFDPEGTEIIDDYHIVIALKRPFAPALNYLTSSSVRAFIVPHDYMEENGEDALNQNPIGTGPYQCVEWVVSSHVDMTRFDGYWGEAPAIKDVRIRFINESTARAIALETGEIDLASSLDDADIESILNGEKEHIVGYMVDSCHTNYIAFNLNFEPFQDLRVRQAIAYGVDWQGVSIAGGETSFTFAESSLAPAVQYFTSVGSYEYDPDKARELLAEAGYADGFELNCADQDVPASNRMLEAVQAYLADLNITMNITVSDTATWIDSLNNGTCDITLISLTSGTGDPSNMYNNMRSTSAMTVGRVNDERFNELASEGLGALDETERGEIYAEIQQYIFDNVLQIPVNHKKQAYGLWDYVEGFYPDPGQLISIKDLSYILE